MTPAALDPFALAAAAFTPREHTLADAAFPTPGSLAMALDPANNLNPPHLQVLDQHLVRAAAGELSRLLVTMPPQEGKSTRISLYFVLWLLKHNPDLRIGIVSFEHDKATRWGREIRDAITNNELGLRVREDVKAAGRWKIDGRRGSVFCTGWQGSITGEPIDVLIIDDPVKGAKEVDSPTYRDDQWDWWIPTGRARLGPNAIVVAVMTRWHPDDLGGRWIREEGRAEDGGRWTVLNIPAQAEVNDPLGREPGEWLPSARGRTVGQWEQLKAETPDRWWTAQYQGRPTPPEGAVWQQAWIDDHRVTTGQVPPIVRCLVMVDPSGTSEGGAETGIVVQGLGVDGDVYVLDDRSLRADPATRARTVCEAAVDWMADEIVVEEDYGGDNVEQVIRSSWQEFARTAFAARRLAKVPRIRSVRAKGHGSKRLRAEWAAGFAKQGRVHHVIDEINRIEQLERQMLEWTGSDKKKSPDRLDAYSHGVRELMAGVTGAQQDLRSRGQRLAGRR